MSSSSIPAMAQPVDRKGNVVDENWLAQRLVDAIQNAESGENPNHGAMTTYFTLLAKLVTDKGKGDGGGGIDPAIAAALASARDDLRS